MGALENKKLMQEIFAGLKEGERSLLQEHLAEDFRVVVMGHSSWSQTVTGEALRKY